MENKTILSDILLWNKIGRIVTQVHKALDITPERDYLYLMGDLYIVDELILELQGR